MATVERALPTRVATSSWLNPNSSISCLIGFRRLERIEILALEVLDECELELLAIGELPDDRRDPLESGCLGGTEPPLAGDELVAVDGLGHEDRLEDPVLDDALGERRELIGIEPLPWLVRVRADPGDRDVDRRRLARAALRDERGQAASEALRAVRVGRS